MSAVREKLARYKNWGVQHAWLVDPHARRLYICDTGLVEVARFELPELDVIIEPSDIFDWN